MSFGSIAGIALAGYLPGSDPTTKSMTGSIIGGLLEKTAVAVGQKGFGAVGYWWQKKYKIVIDRGGGDELIYDKLERYIIKKYFAKLQSCTLKPKDGEIVTCLNSGAVSSQIVETWRNHKIYYSFGTKEIGNEKQKIIIEQIILESNTATIQLLKEYVEGICHYRESSRTLQIFRAVVEHVASEKKCATKAYWSLVNVVTNKRIDNTILSESAEKELYNDVDKFLNSQEWYDRKGIPFKRGYFLYGVPGTGKTSCIKAIANQYHLNIFSVQMNDISNNSQFTLLMTRITEFTGNRPYILALEDFDRCAMFDRYSDGKLSMGSILNELDGVTESFGRILFITANSRERFSNQVGIDALFRPGRIDKEIELTFCDKRQLERMISHFANVEVQIPDTAIPKKLTPASVISILQQNADSGAGGGGGGSVNDWQFWSNVISISASTNAIGSTTINNIAANKRIANLEKKIRQQQHLVKRYTRTVKNVEKGVNKLETTKTLKDNANNKLVEMRAKLRAQKKKAQETKTKSNNSKKRAAEEGTQSRKRRKS